MGTPGWGHWGETHGFACHRGIVLRTVSFRSGLLGFLSNFSLRGLGSPLPMWSPPRIIGTRLT